MIKRPPTTPGYDPLGGDVADLFPGSRSTTLPPATAAPQAGGVPANGMPAQARPPMTPPGLARVPGMPAAPGLMTPPGGNPMQVQNTTAPLAPVGGNAPMTPPGQGNIVNTLTQRLLRSRGLGS